MDALCSYTPDFIDLCQKVKNYNYQLGQQFWPVSQIDVQRNMLGFLVEGHIYEVCVAIF